MAVKLTVPSGLAMDKGIAIIQRNFSPHQLQQIAAHQYAFQQGYNQDSTYQLPDHMVVQGVPRETGKTGFECIGKSETTITQTMIKILAKAAWYSSRKKFLLYLYLLRVICIHHVRQTKINLKCEETVH